MTRKLFCESPEGMSDLNTWDVREHLKNMPEINSQVGSIQFSKVLTRYLNGRPSKTSVGTVGAMRLG